VYVSRAPSKKRMKLTSLVAAPGWQDEVPPRAPHGKLEGRSASQLVAGVRPTRTLPRRSM
jgi:hypothetical protein